MNNRRRSSITSLSDKKGLPKIILMGVVIIPNILCVLLLSLFVFKYLRNDHGVQGSALTSVGTHTFKSPIYDANPVNSTQSIIKSHTNEIAEPIDRGVVADNSQKESVNEDLISVVGENFKTQEVPDVSTMQEDTELSKIDSLTSAPKDFTFSAKDMRQGSHVGILPVDFID